MTLTDAVAKCFQDEPDRVFTIQELCDTVHKHYEFSPLQEELDPKYPQPLYKHEIRSIVARFKKLGYIIRIARNQYQET